MTAFPPGELRLDDTEATTDPTVADLFIVPCALTAHFPNRDSLYRLPHFKGNEAKHVLLDVTDNEQRYGLPSLFIRCNTRTWYFMDDPNTIGFPWPVEDFAECTEIPGGGFKYDVSFQGWLWSNTRKTAVESCRNQSRLKNDFATYTDFYGYIDKTPEGERRRAEYIRSLRESRLALCPESIHGVFPYRFFEAMSAARVPVLIGSEFVFPFADEIPYPEFILHIERRDAAGTGNIISNYLQQTPDEELIRRGRMGQEYWRRFLNFRADHTGRLFTHAVRKKLCA